MCDEDVTMCDEDVTMCDEDVTRCDVVVSTMKSRRLCCDDVVTTL
jgi:hypothetical protein